MAIKIVIDAGHNPQTVNAGAEGFGYREQDITYAVSQELATLLRQNGNFEVRLTRNTPTEILGTSNLTSLQERVRVANEWPADYFISIHANASVNPAANGTEAYTFRPFGEAFELAEEIVEGIVERMGTRDLGVKANPSLYVLRRTSMPAVLVELAFISNAEDVQKMVSDPQGFARGIYNGILDYFDLG
ncbi:MAG: N-acetylmuramoyl-L-alanine amidase [Clostridia bacterium]|nr:N-acetylmuramoyl-L-alanine amidase [Clostridia bacterium]